MLEIWILSALLALHLVVKIFAFGATREMRKARRELDRARQQLDRSRQQMQIAQHYHHMWNVENIRQAAPEAEKIKLN